MHEHVDEIDLLCVCVHIYIHQMFIYTYIRFFFIYKFDVCEWAITMSELKRNDLLK